MQDSRPFRISGWFGLGLWILAGFAGTATAQQVYRTDPVEQLKQVLKNPVEDSSKPEELAARQKALEERVRALRTIGDLQRALALTEWLDTSLDEGIARIDRTVRNEVVKRLEDSLRLILDRAVPANQWAAANVIGELSTTIRETGSTKSVTRRLAPDLVKLIKEGTPPVREAAVRAMSNITPDPQVGAAAIGEVLQSNSATLRRAAAGALGNLIQRSLSIIGGRGKGTLGVQSTWTEVLQTAAAVIPEAARGLSDEDAEVRRLSTDAIGQAAFALYDYLFEPTKSLRMPRELDRGEAKPLTGVDAGDERVGPALESLTKALLAQAPLLAKTLNDPNPVIRHQARRALENIADARRRLDTEHGPQTGLPGTGRPRVDAHLGQVKGDLLQLLQATLDNLKAGVRDSSEPVRLATLEVLELMGDAAAPAAPEIVTALSDPSLFVRWVAARSLGRMSKPVEVATAVPALARFLDDRDLDLRMVGAVTLERYGQAAQAAIPALARAAGRGDVEGRIAAIRALETIIKEPSPAVLAIAAELKNPNHRVRQAAAEALGGLGVLARAALEPLREALNDSDPDVRRAVSEALLAIVPSADEK
jgi:HEAT repeat protein